MTWVISGALRSGQASSALVAASTNRPGATLAKSSLRTLVLGLRNSPFSASKKSGFLATFSVVNSLTAVCRVEIWAESKDVAIKRCPRRVSPGCAAKTSRALSWYKMVGGTAVWMVLIITGMTRAYVRVSRR